MDIEKFCYFAQYWGQNILKNCAGNKRLLVDSSCLDNISDYFLECKSLYHISDEDAKEVIRIFNGSILRYELIFENKTTDFREKYRQVYYIYNGERKIVANFLNSGLHVLKSNNDLTYLKAYDCLKSKGYLVPYRENTVEMLIYKGWAKVQTDIELVKTNTEIGQI